jgi:hypothetical protein
MPVHCKRWFFPVFDAALRSDSHGLGCVVISGADDKQSDSKQPSKDSAASDSKSGAAPAKQGGAGKNERIAPPLDRTVTVTFTIPPPLSAAQLSAISTAAAATPLTFGPGLPPGAVVPSAAPSTAASTSGSSTAAPSAVTPTPSATPAPAPATAAAAAPPSAAPPAASATGATPTPPAPLKPEQILLLPAATDNELSGDESTATQTQPFTQVLDENNEWRTVSWERVRVGHVVRVATKVCAVL